MKPLEWVFCPDRRHRWHQGTGHVRMVLGMLAGGLALSLGMVFTVSAEPVNRRQVQMSIPVPSVPQLTAVPLPDVWVQGYVAQPGQAALEVPYLQTDRLPAVSSLFVATVSLCVGILAFLLWMTQPGLMAGAGRDPLYLFMGVNALAWAVLVSKTLVDFSLVPWPWWGVFTAGAFVVWVAFTFLFCHQVLRPVTRQAWLLTSLCLLSGLAAAYFALLSGQFRVWSTWLGALTLWTLAYVGWYAWRVWVERRSSGMAERLVVTGTLILAMVSGIHEMVGVNLNGDFYGENGLARYTSPLFGTAFVFIVARRFRLASEQSRDLAHDLALRVTQREEALAISYGKMEQLAREQSSAAERVRILRNMHDGVGSHISTAIRQLESGRSQTGEVLHTLRDSLDQLKLSIDAMTLPSGDLNALLANIRYRLEPRFLACNIPWMWRVNALEPISRLDSNALQQLQFMLFETLSNVLQHAKASALEISAAPWGAQGQGAQLQVIDNGRGFDVVNVHRRGLLSMRERAKAIGATLNITSVPGRTVVEITFK